MLEAVEGGLYSLEVVEVVEVMCCVLLQNMLEAVEAYMPRCRHGGAEVCGRIGVQACGCGAMEACTRVRARVGMEGKKATIAPTRHLPPAHYHCALASPFPSRSIVLVEEVRGRLVSKGCAGASGF